MELDNNKPKEPPTFIKSIMNASQKTVTDNGDDTILWGILFCFLILTITMLIGLQTGPGSISDRQWKARLSADQA